MGKLLDCILGVHSKSRFINEQLRALIELHTVNELKKHHVLKPEQAFDLENEGELGQTGQDVQTSQGQTGEISPSSEVDPNIQNNLNPIVVPSNSLGLGLGQHQANLIISAIDVGKTKARDIMVPMQKTYMINYDEIFDYKKLVEIYYKGYSRIPIYKDENLNHLFGILRIKKLIGIIFNFEDHIKTLRETMEIHKIRISKPLIVSPDTSLIELLRQFKKGKSHMAFITEKADEFKDMIGLDDNNSEIGGMRVSGQFNKCEQTSESCIDVLGNYIINKITI